MELLSHCESIIFQGLALLAMLQSMKHCLYTVFEGKFQRLTQSVFADLGLIYLALVTFAHFIYNLTKA